jgi:hypothetical protein
MHLVGHGLANQLVDLVGGNSLKAKHYTKCDLFLGQAAATKIFGDMERSRSLIPTAFHGSFRKPHGRHSTRAVDWIDIARYTMPALFVCKLKDPGAKVALLSIVKFIQISLQPTITISQLGKMQR